MTTRYRDTADATERAKRGTGSIREQISGVWEVRVVVGFDPVHARSVQRSFTVHGDVDVAERRRRELVDDYGLSRVAFSTDAARLTVAELMERFLEAPHLWKPPTVVSHRPVVKALMSDALGRRRLVTLTPGDVRAAICRWQADGVSVPTVSARWLVLRSAISWAVGEGVAVEPAGRHARPSSPRTPPPSRHWRGPPAPSHRRAQRGANRRRPSGSARLRGLSAGAVHRRAGPRPGSPGRRLGRPKGPARRIAPG